MDNVYAVIMYSYDSYTEMIENIGDMCLFDYNPISSPLAIFDNEESAVKMIIARAEQEEKTLQLLNKPYWLDTDSVIYDDGKELKASIIHLLSDDSVLLWIVCPYKVERG